MYPFQFVPIDDDHAQRELDASVVNADQGRLDSLCIYLDEGTGAQINYIVLSVFLSGIANGGALEANIPKLPSKRISVSARPNQALLQQAASSASEDRSPGS